MELTQEIEPIKEHIIKAEDTINAIQIKDQQSLTQASIITSDIKLIQKELKEKKEAITKPMNTALKSARDLFRPYEEQLKNAESIIKSKVVDYNKIVEAEREKAEKELQDKIDKGEEVSETDKFIVEQMKTKVVTDRGGMSIKKVKSFRVLDITKLPVDYLLPNEVLIRKAMYLNIEIPGVSFFTIDQVVAK